MGFDLEYLGDGTVKGTLSLTDEVGETVCPKPKKETENLKAQPEKILSKEKEVPVREAKEIAPT
jgi:hypothetical protein